MSLKNIDLDDDMKAPCLCDCGEWFDLDDGYPSLYSSKVICKTCHQDEDEEESEEELEDEDSEEF